MLLLRSPPAKVLNAAFVLSPSNKEFDGEFLDDERSDFRVTKPFVECGMLGKAADDPKESAVLHTRYLPEPERQRMM